MVHLEEEKECYIVGSEKTQVFLVNLPIHKFRTPKTRDHDSWTTRMRVGHQEDDNSENCTADTRYQESLFGILSLAPIDAWLIKEYKLPPQVQRLAYLDFLTFEALNERIFHLANKKPAVSLSVKFEPEDPYQDGHFGTLFLQCLLPYCPDGQKTQEPVSISPYRINTVLRSMLGESGEQTAQDLTAAWTHHLAGNQAQAHTLLVIHIHGATYTDNPSRYFLSAPGEGCVEVHSLFTKLSTYFENQFKWKFAIDIAGVYLFACNPFIEGPTRDISSSITAGENPTTIDTTVANWIVGHSLFHPYADIVREPNTKLSWHTCDHFSRKLNTLLTTTSRHLRIIHNSLPVPLFFALSNLPNSEGDGRAVSFPTGLTLLRP